MSEFYSLRRNAITDLSAFFGFVIGFLGSAPIAYPYLRVGFQTQEIVKGFAWFIGITIGSGLAIAVAGLGVGRVLGFLWERTHRVVRRAKGHEVPDESTSSRPTLVLEPPVSSAVTHRAPADAAYPVIRYAQGVDATQYADLLARSSVQRPDASRLRQAMMLTTNFGAYDGNTLVGALRLLSDNYEWSVVTEIVVDPAYRRRGIGRELMLRAAGSASGRFAVASVPPGTEGFFRRLDAIPAYEGFVRGAKSRLQ